MFEPGVVPRSLDSGESQLGGSGLDTCRTLAKRRLELLEVTDLQIPGRSFFSKGMLQSAVTHTRGETLHS